jgi:hypothetical protein
MKRIVASMALFLWIGISHAQTGINNPYWIFSGASIHVDNFSSPSAAPVTLPGPISTKVTANNALFTTDGRVLFYLKSDLITKNLFVVDRNGFEQPLALDPNLFTPMFWSNISQNEILIIPVPTVCNQYYIVFGIQLFVLGGNPIREIAYSRISINPTNGRITVLDNSVRIVRLFGLTDIANIGMAVGKISTNGPFRYLYIVGPTGYEQPGFGFHVNNLVRFKVDAVNISQETVLNGSFTGGLVPPPHNGAYFCREADLNDAGTALYWGEINTNGRLRKFDLNTNALGLINASSFGSYSGVEFQKNGNFDRVFYSVQNTSGDNGVFYVNENGSSVTPNPVVASNTFNKTHVERGTDGMLYVSDGNVLRGIDGITATPTLGPILGVNNPLLNGYYSLPDQLDGENYWSAPILPVCDDVETYINVSSNIAGTGALPRFTEVSNRITAQRKVTVIADSKVEFKAQKEIILSPGGSPGIPTTLNDDGFIAVANSEFRAFIDVCRMADSCAVTGKRIALTVDEFSSNSKDDSEQAFTVEVFPNPTTGRITILSKGLNAELPLKASLYTRDGKLIKSWEWTKPSIEESLLLEGADTFVLRLEQGETRFTQTIIVQP